MVAKFTVRGAEPKPVEKTTEWFVKKAPEGDVWIGFRAERGGDWYVAKISQNTGKMSLVADIPAGYVATDDRGRIVVEK